MATNLEALKVNFSKSQYSNAVTQLNTKMKELEAAREDYSKQRDAIPQFWEGDAKDDAYEVIGANIENVKTAYKAVEESMKAYKEAGEEGDQITSETKQKLEDARRDVQSLFQS